jgi:hypothetical protein
MAAEAFVDLSEKPVQTCAGIFSGATARRECGLEGIGHSERKVSHTNKRSWKKRNIKQLTINTRPMKCRYQKGKLAQSKLSQAASEGGEFVADLPWS